MIVLFNPNILDKLLKSWTDNIVSKVVELTEALSLSTKSTASSETRLAFTEATKRFLGSDRHWYTILTYTEVLLPGDTIAIPKTPVFYMPSMNCRRQRSFQRRVEVGHFK
jgi:hypothetical protein